MCPIDSSHRIYIHKITKSLNFVHKLVTIDVTQTAPKKCFLKSYQGIYVVSATGVVPLDLLEFYFIPPTLLVGIPEYPS